MRSKTVLWWLLALVLLPASTLIGGYTWLQTPDGKRWLADRIETAFNTQDRQLSIGALDGAIPFSPETTDVSFSDSEGRWLMVDRAAIRLDPTAIFRWKARFEAIEVGRVEMLRLPTAPDSATEDLSPTTFTWPELPISIEIERLNVAEVALDASVLGEPARFSVEGEARFGDPATGLSLDLSIARTDNTPGKLTARMRYVPDTQRLATKLVLDEPEGGMLARLAGLEGLPALTADLSGDGPLDDWHADLTLRGGHDLHLGAEAAIRAEQAGRRVTLEASGRLAALADDVLTPLLDASTSLGGSVLVGPDDRLRIDRLELGGSFGEASLAGGVDLAGQSMDLAMTLIPGTPDRYARLIDGVSWSALRLSASLKGGFLEPTLSLSMEAGTLAYRDMAMESLTANAEVVAAGPLVDPGSRIEIATHFLVEGMDPGPGIPSEFLASEIRVDAQGSIDRAGLVVVDSLKIDAPVARISARGNGEGWGAESATIGVILDLPELSRLAPLAKRPLEGAGTLELSADWDGIGAAIWASAELEQLSTGTAAADTLLGGAPQLALEASLSVDGSVAIKSLELSGSGLLVWLSGAIGTDELGIDWQLSLADLAAVATALDGSLAATGRLTGTPDDPDVTARLTLAEAALAGHPISQTRLDADFTGLFTSPVGRVAAEGNVAGLPAQATAELQFEKDGAIRIEELVLGLASLSGSGALVLNADYGASGRVSAGVGNLADLSPLVGAALSGALEASATLSQDAGHQMIDFQASATDAGLPGVVESRQATLNLQLSDPLTEPKVAAQLQADGVSAGDLMLDRVVATAEGGLSGLDVALDLAAGTLYANAKGRVAVADGETRIEIASLSARHDQVKASLAGPARIALAQDLVLVDGLVLQAEGGRLKVDGRYGDRSDMNLTISGVPLELIRLAAPDLELSGRLDGGARLTGTRAAPRASGDLTATGLTLPAVRQAGIAGLDVKSRIDWDASALSLDASVSGGFGGSLSASTRLSAPADPTTGLPNFHGGSSLTGRVSGSVRLDVLNDLLAARGDRVDGSIAIDLSLTGRLDDPRLGGTLALTDGSYRGPLTGISLDDISARLIGEGDRLTVSGFSASTPNGGTVRASGNIGLDAGLPADISVVFADALVVDNDLISAEVAGAVAVTGKLTRALDLAGRLTVVEAEIRLPERLPPSIQTLNVKEINLPPELETLRPPPPPKAGGSGAPLGIVLDLAIDSPGRIFVRGHGLEAEVAGEVTVRGNASAPDIAGGFQLRRGYLNALGRRFSFNEGVVTLPADGSVDADIRFVARAQASDVSAQITVTGRASAPQIQVESVPELPQDEILARILFGKRSASLSALESIQLARSAFQLTGIGSSPDLLGGVRSRLGLDGIEVQQKGTDAGGPALNLRRRIAEGISLGVQQGLQAGSGRATVELELMPNVSVETEVGVNNTGRVGIGVEWEY